MLVTMSESKLKRSPYLSQMTKAANADLMDTLSRPDRECGNSSDSTPIGGYPRDFFQLKRPAGGTKARARPRQQHLNMRAGVKSSIKFTSSPGNIRKVASVAFARSIQCPSQSTLISSSSGEVSVNTSIRNMSLSESEHSHQADNTVQSQQDSKQSQLQYYYTPSMRSSAIAIDINNPPQRSKTFQEMLDEGDGKDGDLNLRLRNEQWKAFDCLEAPVKKKRGPMYTSNGVVSANDLAAMRRNASRMKMDADSTFGVLSKSRTSASLSGSYGRCANTLTSGESSHSRSLRRADFTSKRSYSESSSKVVHTVSAGLAYGSDHIRVVASFEK
jgi:hypothetical protein